MKVREARTEDVTPLAALVARFRVELRRLRGIESTLDTAAAGAEIAEYLERDFPVYVAEARDGQLAGYLVCRVDGSVVWVESVYVAEDRRRQGVGSLLYARAERLAERLGGQTPYNWVHPNNDRMIRFLASRGYDVLNLIELRRARQNERPAAKVRVGEYEFRY